MEIMKEKQIKTKMMIRWSKYDERIQTNYSEKLSNSTIVHLYQMKVLKEKQIEAKMVMRWSKDERIQTNYSGKLSNSTIVHFYQMIVIF